MNPVTPRCRKWTQRRTRWGTAATAPERRRISADTFGSPAPLCTAIITHSQSLGCFLFSFQKQELLMYSQQMGRSSQTHWIHTETSRQCQRQKWQRLQPDSPAAGGEKDMWVVFFSPADAVLGFLFCFVCLCVTFLLFITSKVYSVLKQEEKCQKDPRKIF